MAYTYFWRLTLQK